MSEPFLFYYEKLDNRPDPRDFRTNLKNIFCAKFNGKRIGQIPPEIELTIRMFKSRPDFGYKYKVIFDNWSDYVETDDKKKSEIKEDGIKTIFTKDRFMWISEENEFGLTDL